MAFVGGVLPPTALQQGYWECDVDGTWIAYEWPAWSILEQAFCQARKCEVKFRHRRINYHMKLKELWDMPNPSGEVRDFRRATQVNVETGKTREARRWPSLAHRTRGLEQARAQAEQKWARWLQADWTWCFFDQDEVITRVLTSSSSQAALARSSYKLGMDGCHVALPPWLPEPLRSWPTQELSCAQHPSGRSCGFALQCVCPASATPALRNEYEALRTFWEMGGLKDRFKLVGGYRIQNRGLLHDFMGAHQSMLARLKGEEFTDGAGRESQLSVRLLWHGTPKVSNLLDICNHGFDRALANNCLYGKGCYFAASASYSNKYACPVQVPTEKRKFRAMVIAAVLVGELVQGTSNMYPPPHKSHSKTGERFENACDNVKHPNIFVTFRDGQALPAYVVVYEDKV